MKQDWLKDLNELDGRYQYHRRHKKLWRTHIIGGHKYTNMQAEDVAKARLKELRKLAGRDVAEVKEWLQENLTGPQQIQLLWILREDSLDPIDDIMRHEVTEISTICQKEFGISPKGDM